MKTKEKEMKISQTFALCRLLQGLGLAFLACALVIGATGSTSAVS